MRSRSKILGVAMLALLGLAAIGGSAQAKTIWGWFLVATPAATPVGVTFTANGLPVWNAASGFDSSGVLKCGVRPRANNQTLTNSACPVATTTFQASIRSSANTWCTTANVAWNGATIGCQTAALPFTASNGVGGNYSLAGFARGWGNQ